jgi:hypothetical protein
VPCASRATVRSAALHAPRSGPSRVSPNWRLTVKSASTSSRRSFELPLRTPALQRGRVARCDRRGAEEAPAPRRALPGGTAGPGGGVRRGYARPPLPPQGHGRMRGIRTPRPAAGSGPPRRAKPAEVRMGTRGWSGGLVQSGGAVEAPVLADVEGLPLEARVLADHRRLDCRSSPKPSPVALRGHAAVRLQLTTIALGAIEIPRFLTIVSSGVTSSLSVDNGLWLSLPARDVKRYPGSAP